MKISWTAWTVGHTKLKKIVSKRASRNRSVSSVQNQIMTQEQVTNEFEAWLNSKEEYIAAKNILKQIISFGWTLSIC